MRVIEQKIMSIILSRQIIMFSEFVQLSCLASVRI
jgi:hypothetical protein